MSSCVPSLAGQVCPWEEIDLLLCLPGRYRQDLTPPVGQPAACP